MTVLEEMQTQGARYVLDRPAPPLERRTSDWERHKGHGGPKVLPPPGVTWTGRGGRPQGHRYYTRVTTLAKAIDDTSKLMAWKMRGVLVGLGQRPDYVVAAASLTMRPEDRDAANELADKALEAAGPSAALVGTALHTWTERLDRGEPLGFVPEHLRPLLDAYVELTAPLTLHHREVRMICDDLETAGTPDAIGTCSIPDPDGVVDGLRIIDLKSGKVAYPGPMSIQLATYGRSDLYDPATGERTPLEDVNQRWGLIVHTQQDGEVPPGLYWLNLQHGNEGIELCRLVRSWRKVKPQDVLRPVHGAAPEDAVAGLRVEDTVVVEQDDAPAPAERGACRSCGRDSSLVRGGLVRAHGPRDNPCAGSGEPPAAAEAAEPAAPASVHAPAASTTDQDEGSAALPAGAIVCGGEPTAADVETVAEFARVMAPRWSAPEPEPDRWFVVRAAVRTAVTTADLDLLWRQSGAEWPADLAELATARHGELQRQERLARPRAALAAAIRTATEQELHALWTTHGQTEAWTEEHAELSRARYAELTAA